jgi:two-component system sensor histidine kinase KdpD
VAGTGGHPPRCPEDGETTVDVDAEHAIVLHGSPLRAGDRRVLEAFAVQTSLVLEYRRLRERGDRAAALERAEATSTALLRAVSHDLRTPLAITRAAVDGLASDALASGERAELVAAVAESTGRLEQLIDDLLDLSRVESGSLRPVLRARSLEEVLPVAVSGHAPGAVELVLDESVPFVRTDGGLLTRVVANLVSNAVRHGRGAPVRVAAHVLADTVEVHVVDRGPGVPADVRDQMFEPFQRLDDTGSEGLGLGLAVARGLTDALEGTLTAEDTPGGGLTMVLALPRAGRDEEDA